MRKSSEGNGHGKEIETCPYCKSIYVYAMNWTLLENKNGKKFVITLNCNTCDRRFIREYFITKIEEYVLQESDKNIIKILNLISKLEKNNSKNHVSIDELKRHTSPEMSSKEFEKTLEKMKRKGDIFEPIKGVIAKI